MICRAATGDRRRALDALVDPGGADKLAHCAGQIRALVRAWCIGRALNALMIICAAIWLVYGAFTIRVFIASVDAGVRGAVAVCPGWAVCLYGALNADWQASERGA